METYSQLEQDIKVINFYKNKNNGYFIEIGAYDGIFLSNTYLLEKNYNWKGICIEPLPDKFIELQNNRPNSICINKAIFDENGLILNFSNSTVGSGITSHIDCHLYIKNSPQIKVETVLLNDILENYNAPSFIEYLSIDTEGTEYEIFKTINYDKYIFGVIHTEHNYVEPKRTNIKNLLISKGYIYIGENQWDDEFIHSSLKIE